MPAAARKTDKCVPHCSPFTVAKGSENVFVDRKAAARVGDAVTSHKTNGELINTLATAASFASFVAPPPYNIALKVVGKLFKCKNHTPSIGTGSTSVFINGKAAAFVGSGITSCTRVAAGSKTVFIGK